MTDHPIPDEALESDIATLAQKGAGKTFLNKGMVERLLDMGRRVVVVDVLNIWWGLKVLADGSPGYPVVVIGGPNGDLPLDPTKGVELATYIAGADVRMVIDVSELRTGELVRFSTAFFAELFRLNRDPLWLILEEADVFAPQNPQPNETMMLHEVDRIVRRGRHRGFRVWTITQRPQEINKKILSQTPVMVLMRLMSPQDRKAAETWLLSHAGKARAAEIDKTLASLEVGEGYLLAPSLGLLTRSTFPMIKTLDNSKTPKAGETRVAIKALAQVDVGDLAKALAPAAEELVVPNNGAAAQADRILSTAMAEKHYQRGFEAGKERGLEEGERIGERRGRRMGYEEASKAIGQLRNALLGDPIEVAPRPSQTPPHSVTVVKTAPAQEIRSSPHLGEARVGRLVTVGADGVERDGPVKLSAATLKIIAFYEAVAPRAVPFIVAAKQAGVGMKSSQFRTYEPELVASGRVESATNGYRALVSAGSPEEYLDQVQAQLSPSHARIFRLIRQSNGRGLSKEEIIIGAEISPTSSTTTAALSLLINEAEVVEKDGDTYRLVEAYR